MSTNTELVEDANGVVGEGHLVLIDHPYGNDDMDMEQVVELAQATFWVIAQSLLAQGKSVREFFNELEIVEDGKGWDVETLSVKEYKRKLQTLGIDTESKDVTASLRIIMKPELDDGTHEPLILFSEFALFLLNYGVAISPE